MSRQPQVTQLKGEKGTDRQTDTERLRERVLFIVLSMAQDHIRTEEETDRQTDIDRQTDRHRQTDRQT